jgi:hypothetical protein
VGTTPETKNSLCQESSSVPNSLNGTAVKGELLHRNMLILSLIEQHGITKRPLFRHDYLSEEDLPF